MVDDERISSVQYINLKFKDRCCLSIFAAVIYGADGKQVMRSHSLDVNNHECLSRVDTISMSGKHFHLCWERHNNYSMIVWNWNKVTASCEGNGFFNLVPALVLSLILWDICVSC